MTKKKTDPIDMSAEAIDARLEELRALCVLTTSLARARIVGPAAPVADRR